MPHKDPEVRRAYNLARREQQLAYGKEYREKNRELLKQKGREYRKTRTLEQRSKRTEYNRAYWRKHHPKKDGNQELR